MTLYRSSLCTLALFVAMPIVGGRGAEAAFIRRSTIKTVANSGIEYRDPRYYRVVVVVGDDSVMNVVSRVESDAGSEDVTLTESDAWLHGAATIKALPTTDATLTLTLYDKASAPLISFKGTLKGHYGDIYSMTAVAGDSGSTCVESSKEACTEDTSAAGLDIEVLAGEVFAASGGYELSVDLAGADTHEVAYGTFVVTESDEQTTCDKSGGCTTTGSTTTTEAEVGWDEIGSVWEGGLTLAPEGLMETKVTAYDSAGKKLESAKSKLGVPWIDGGEGVSVLATDEDPLTAIGTFKQSKYNYSDMTGYIINNVTSLVVNSEGWTSTTVPVSAKVELSSGSTITIPVNSYQRRTKAEFYCEDIKFNFKSSWARLAVNDSTFDVLAGSLETYELGTPVCDDGTCVSLIETETGECALSVSVYGTDATKLPDDAEITTTLLDDSGKEISTESEWVEFDDDVTAVFANEVAFSEDPIGLDLSGKVSLLGAADQKGKQKTLAKGKFYGSFSRDGDGDLDLAGADKDAVSARGDVVVAGDPIQFGLQTDDDGNAVYVPPPLTPVFGNGSGTKNASNQASAKPELL